MMISPGHNEQTIITRSTLNWYIPELGFGMDVKIRKSLQWYHIRHQVSNWRQIACSFSNCNSADICGEAKVWMLGHYLNFDIEKNDIGNSVHLLHFQLLFCPYFWLFTALSSILLASYSLRFWYESSDLIVIGEVLCLWYVQILWALCFMSSMICSVNHYCIKHTCS